MKKFLNRLHHRSITLTILSSCDKTGKVKVYEKNHIVTLENQITGLSFDLTKGTYVSQISRLEKKSFQMQN